jgi:hypothetical protein
MTIFDSQEDIRKKKKAIDLFVSLFKGSYQQLDPSDIDYKIFDATNNLIAYAEIMVRNRPISKSYPLPVHAKKLVKLIDKRITPVVIWACDDGIIYAKAHKLRGDILYSDYEMVAYYDKQKEFKYVKYS